MGAESMCHVYQESLNITNTSSAFRSPKILNGIIGLGSHEEPNNDMKEWRIKGGGGEWEQE